jgi:hypothetical protein
VAPPADRFAEKRYSLRRVTRVFGKIFSELPPQQFFDAVDWVFRDAPECIIELTIHW